MSGSGIYVVIKLDPFYQHFLREHFNQRDEIVFSFPKGHDLLKKFEILLTKYPLDKSQPDHGESKFMIEVPYMQHKNPYVYNYISETRNNILGATIKNFTKMIFHEHMNKYAKVGFQKKQCIEIFMEEYNIDPKYQDRLTKDYQRWIEAVCHRRKRKQISTL